MRFLFILVFFTSHIFAQQKVKDAKDSSNFEALRIGPVRLGLLTSTSNCVVQSSDKVCCNPKVRTEITIIKSQSEFESRKDYNLIKGAIGVVDFANFDLIVVKPGDLKMTFEFIGTPTSSGREWMIYNNFFVDCNRDSVNISLDCSPTAGSSGAFYWKIVSKLNSNKINCGCRAIGIGIGSFINALKPNEISKNEYVYYAGSSAKPGKILKSKTIRAPKISKYTYELLKPIKQGSVVVRGKVKSKNDAEGTLILFTNLNKGTSRIGAVSSGNYEVALDPGVYKVEFKNSDNASFIIDRLVLGEEQIQRIDVDLGEGPKEFKIISKKPLTDAGLKKRIKQLEK